MPFCGEKLRRRDRYYAGPSTKAEAFYQAIADVGRGMCNAPLWLAMGSQDIRQRYRRSRVGPFWISLSMGVTVAALGFLYGALFQQPLEEYLPYLASGFVVWGLIAGLINDGASTFIRSEGLIRQLAAPLSIYAYREVWGNLLFFLHNLVVYVIVILVFRSWPGAEVLLVVPGIAILLLNGIGLGLLLGLASARFRDVPQILASIVQVMFFVTPILWKVEMLPERALLLDFNPFFHMLEIVRSPLLGQSPSSANWLVASAVTGIVWVFALISFSKYRWRIAYWV
jgi:ABC-2 type transport system permease protein/lipopolysaccharide transport system permease protein